MNGVCNEEVSVVSENVSIMMRTASCHVAILLVLIGLSMACKTAKAEERITIAVASDLRFALGEIVTMFKRTHSAAQIETIYGSSGKLSTQIRQGAPYDIFFSADIAFPRALKADGFGYSEAQPYGVGHIVLWSQAAGAATLTFADLTDPSIRKIAIANPEHAPYGKRAEEALKAMGVWDGVEHKLVYGENATQAVQYVQSGNAQVGIVALSLVLGPELSGQGGYVLIPDELHQPLEQGYIITKRAAANSLAQAFTIFFSGNEVRAILARYGFTMPVEVE